jgi:glycerophosphoryl diester phosphodiesterase
MLEATLGLDTFSQNEKGMFVVLEEEGTDNFGNNNNAQGTTEAVLRADEAIGVAQDYIDHVNPNTLLVTAADSDGGGLEINDVEGETVGSTEVQPPFDTEVPYDGTTGNDTAPFTTGAPDADGDNFDFGLAYATTDDVSGSIVSKAYGLNSDLLESTVDNTDMYSIMYQTLFGSEPEEVANGGDETTVETLLGTQDIDIIELEGSDRQVYTGEGQDLVNAAIASGGNNLINLDAGDDLAILGTGDIFEGGEGVDRFFATNGGNNTITGGEGADQFWLANGRFPESANIITDFESGVDVLGIASLDIAFEDLSITDSNGDALITNGEEDLAILQGVDAASLNADNFVFV